MINWIKASRPKTLLLAWASILMGFVYSKDFSQRAIWIAIGMLLTMSLLQIVSNFANDLGDAKKGSDKNRTDRMVSSGKISPQKMKWAIILLSVFAFGTGFFTIYKTLNFSTEFLLFLLLGVGGILTALKYTLGKKNLAYAGLGDVFVFLFFGLIPVLGTSFLIQQTLDFWMIFPAVAVGGLSVGLLNMNNLRDIDEDEKNGKRTLVVKLGYDQGVSYHAAIIFLLSIAILITSQQFQIFLPMLTVIFLVYHLKRVRHIHYKKDYNKELLLLSITTFAYALVGFLETIFYATYF